MVIFNANKKCINIFVTLNVGECNSMCRTEIFIFIILFQIVNIFGNIKALEY